MSCEFHMSLRAWTRVLASFTVDSSGHLRSFAEMAQQAGQPRAADGQHAVDRRLHHDLPVTVVTLPADLPDASQVHARFVVDPMEAVAAEHGGDLAELPDVADRAAAAFADDRVVAVRLEQVDVVGLDSNPSKWSHVKQDAIQ